MSPIYSFNSSLNQFFKGILNPSFFLLMISSGKYLDMVFFKIYFVVNPFNFNLLGIEKTISTNL